MACQGRTSYEEMAATLDVPVTTIQIRLVRARRMVQERLAGNEQVKIPRT
jgi:DNA-directed RNA polymerase specialized sigma24 family protein